MTTKTCQQCSVNYKITDDDLELYQKLAPEFNGKKYPIPVPDICPECRDQKRLGIRNQNMLYKNKCYLCQEEKIFIFSPDKGYKYSCPECFYSDKWDAVDQGRDFDFDRPFFEQFDELIKDSKLMGLFSVNADNSPYINMESDSKNCYLCFGGHLNQDCYYCTYSVEGRDVIDGYWIWKSENLYECVDCVNCSNSTYLTSCQDCFDCHHGYNLVSCKNCFGSTNLRHKEYHFFNEKLEKEEYLKKKAEYSSYEGNIKALKKSNSHFLKYPKKYAKIVNSENATGEDIKNSKNAINVFLADGVENGKNHYIVAALKESYDCSSYAWGEYCYNVASSFESSRSFCSSHLIQSPACIYSFMIFNSQDCFGCVGLIKKQYCIFNKQYSKQEYEDLVPKIIEHMQKTGEWGKFFPYSISPFGYNETMAMHYYPLKKGEALKLGAKWQDNDYGIKYDGPFYKPKDIKEYNPKMNPNAEAEIEECKKGILKCEVTGKPYRILPQELAAYIERGIQIPRKHPDQRHMERLSRLNPRKLYHRQCMCGEKITNDELLMTNERNMSNCNHDGRCGNEFETTYAPDREEIVYCEECYQKEMI